MANWSPRYVNETEKPSQQPVYALVIFEDRTMLGVNASSGVSLLEGDVYDSMVLRERNTALPVMVYDADGFELLTGHYDSATNQVTVDPLGGAYGTTARTFFANQSTIGIPWLNFSTEPIPGTTGLFDTGMGFPSGSSQEMDLIEGYTRSQPLTVEVQDTDARITRALAGRTAIGKTAMVLGGYRGIPFSQFTVLHTGPITRMTILKGSAYEFEIDTVLVKFKRKLFRDVESFSTTLSGSMNSSQTTIPLTDTSGVYDSAPTVVGNTPDGSDYLRAAMYFKVDNEYMRHDTGTSPPTITRGALGSTAASHTSGKTVDMVFVVEGNPISILIGFLLTRDPGFQPVLYSTGTAGYYDFWNTVDDNKAPLGLHLEAGDVDVPGMTAIRDDWFERYAGRMAFSKQTDMETVLRESILKPLGLNLYVTRSGKLALSVLRPPLNSEPVLLDEASIAGVPDIDFTNEELVNEVIVEYDHDYITGEAASTLTLLDATSQSTYDRVGDATLAPTWMRDGVFGGSEGRIERLAKKKMRHHRDPNPMIPLDVLFTETRVDLGDIPRISLANMPDPQAGKIGWDKLAVVVARHVDWQQGALAFDLLNTAYMGNRYCLIAASGTADYVDASTVDRAAYGFIADGATERMSDGTAAYQIM